NYEDLHAPLLERDAFVYRKARKWLDDPSIDVLVLHIIGTDKVSHEYPVRGPEYREKYREVDDFIREVSGRLASTDYVFAISDHGHNELGGHTEDAAYLARGPFFPGDIRHDMTHRPLGYVAFYAGSLIVAYLGFRYRSIVDVLWVAGVAVWLLAYFGPLGYSLLRHGSLIVLIIFPLAAIISVTGWRALLTK